ncbi:hypothetical protein [Pseudomonas batumici]|uniref:Methyl-accepting chemotaxis protein n=1 Tax=Pseudomonas batumici TaxID=226910 RepID=A0A0C2IGR8_9PSED|nr:hypothetical protein [Pseudomonas batumici]KIH84092.1 Methyl-accepting chemotaxis protein [Pseudomonas batumici]
MKRPTLYSAIQGATLILLVGTAVYLGGKLSTLSTVVASTPSREGLDSIQLHLKKVDAELKGLQSQSCVTEADFQIAQQALLQRVEALAADRSVETVVSGLAALTTQVESTEGALLTLKAAVEAPPAPATAPRPSSAVAPGSSSTVPKAVRPRKTSARPPFTVVGLESRGGELFLAVALTGVRRLEDIELLRPGRVFLGWRLEALEPSKARWIRPDGGSFTVSIP